MARALRLAERGRFSAHPNPRVGCVIARNDKLLAEGWHVRTGEAHAEINALNSVGNAEGATVYVTFEPCAHRGRTAPCVDALVSASLSRVVVAMRDPNPLVAGKGITVLRQAGITVEEGLLTDDAAAINAGFIKRMTLKRPRVMLKIAISIDGRTSLADGSSQWITGDAAREDAHRLRAECGAVLTGCGTVIKDNPSLNVRLPGDWIQPVRVIVDSRLSVSVQAKLFELPGQTIIFTTGTANMKQKALLQNNQVDVQTVKEVEGRCDLNAVLQVLGEREINDLLVEAGPTLAGALLQQKLVDECVVYIAPHLLGNKANPLALLPSLGCMEDRLKFYFTDIRRVGGDLRIQMSPCT